jgi:hypothetical protein
MWVNGKPSEAYGRRKLAEGRHIALSYGADAKAPTL